MTLSGAKRSRFLIGLGAGLACLGLAWLLWLTFAQTFVVQWNAPRLAPAAALARGLNIYGTAQHGPFLGWTYGPVFPLVFASIAWLPDQVSIHAAAWMLNLLIAAGPVWLAARCGAGRRAGGAALVAGALLALGLGPAWTALSFIHVDLLCCAFGIVACVALARRLAGGGPQWTIVAASSSVLALGTKQVALGLVVGLAGWLWASGDRRELGRYLGWLALGGIIAAGAMVAVFGLAGPMFGLWTIHLHNPFSPDFGSLLRLWFGDRFREIVPLAIACAVLRPDRPAATPHPVADRLERALWWVALAHLPFGLLAAAKVAGGLNSVHTFNYLGCLLVVRLARVFGEPARLGRVARVALLVALALSWAQGWYGARRAGLPEWPPVQRLRDDEALARRQPGRVYFPWNPLVTVIVEHQVRPFDDALLCLERCGLPADRAAVRAAIPSGALVVYPDPAQSTFALRFLNEPQR